jgi:hypothetical protein
VVPAWKTLCLDSASAEKCLELSRQSVVLIRAWNINKVIHALPLLLNAPHFKILYVGDPGRSGVEPQELDALVQIDGSLWRQVDLCLRLGSTVTCEQFHAFLASAQMRIIGFDLSHHQLYFNDAMLTALVAYAQHTLLGLHMELRHSKLTDNGFIYVAACANLHTLNLTRNFKLTEKSAVVIGSLTSLRVLKLAWTRLTTDTCLVCYQHLTSLERLDLGFTACSLAGLRCIPRKTLKELKLTTWLDVNNVCALFPGVKLVFNS